MHIPYSKMSNDADGMPNGVDSDQTAPDLGLRVCSDLFVRKLRIITVVLKGTFLFTT